MLDWDEERNSQHRRLCSYALTCKHIGEQTILAKITQETTKEQFALAQQQLLELATRLAGQVTLFHYAGGTGTHWCVWDIYTDLSMRLKNLSLMQKPAPEPAAPKQQLITIDGIVVEREEELRTSRDETYLGTDDTPPDMRNTR